jgi:NarL family two-component system response regulator LiaR
MKDVRGVGRGAPAIIGVDSSSDLWKRLSRVMVEQECSGEFILARSSEAPEELIPLSRRLIPALLVIEEAKLDNLPFRELREFISSREIQILVFTDKDDQVSLEYFFHKGCSGAVPADVTNTTLLKAIRAIFAEEIWLPRRVLSKLARDNAAKNTLRGLTPRESDILRLICQGNTNQEIADQLFISRETVRWHVRGIYSKIGVENRMGAIRGGNAFLEGGKPGSAANSD